MTDCHTPECTRNAAEHDQEFQAERLVAPVTRKMRDPSERFWEKVEKTAGCWLWKGHTSQAGYGRFSVLRDGRKRVILAHRFSYEAAKGPIPLGLEIDHLCRVRNCVRPDHLEAVTHMVNVWRSLAVTVVNARKTHCPEGHPYEGYNLRVSAKGYRSCRKCHRAYSKRPVPCPDCGQVISKAAMSRHRNRRHPELEATS